MNTTYIQIITVSEKESAKYLGSGTLEVFGTPAMIALMENTAMRAMEALLGAGETSVGTRIQAQHLKASAVGERITCTATITAIEGRKVSFDIKAINAKGDTVGMAAHDRFVVDAERFMAKLGS